MKRRFRLLLNRAAAGSSRAATVDAGDHSIRTSEAEPVLWHPAPRFHTFGFWAVVLAVGLAPIGIMGPWDGVWSLVGGLMLIATVIGPITRRAMINIGLAAAVALYAALTLAWSPELGTGTPVVLALGIWVVSYLGVSAAAENLRLTHHLRVVAALWTFGIGVGLIVVSQGDYAIKGIEWDWPIRHAAMAGVALAALSLSTRKGRRLSGLGAITLLVGILLTEARTALAALLLIMIAIGVSWVTPRIRTLGTAVLVVGLGLAILAPAVQTRFTGGDTISAISSNRSDVWSATAAACDQWIIGEGTGFANTIARATHDGFPDPHNEFLRFGCDIGVGLLPIVGFVMFAIMRSFSLLGARSNSRIGIASLSAIGTLVIFAGFWNPLTALEYMVPLMAVIALADKSLEVMQEHGYLETQLP